MVSLGAGTGFIRLGGCAASGECRRRTEGLMNELCRIRVPYVCCALDWAAVDAVPVSVLGEATAVFTSMARRSLIER